MRFEGPRMAAERDATAGVAKGRVLEIGCGTGLNFSHYKWESIESLDATEPDPFMLKRARDRAARLPPDIRSRVRLHEAPAEVLPFDDQSFDSAVSTLVLCTVNDPLAATSELARVLKPGGHAYLVEHIRGGSVVGGIQTAIQPVWGWAAAGCHINRNTELALAASGLRLTVQQRFQLGPLLPAIRVVATRPHRTEDTREG